MRISKTVNGVKYTYAYINGLLMYETRGNAKFYYSYDANGTLYSVKYTLTDSSDLMTYYFTHNSRGDIVGIYNGAGQLRAHYEYDAWGNVLSVTDQNGNAITSATHIGNLNPFRYRGYYLDTETGLYYLMSRYYDPVTHRFVNADGYFQSGSDILDTNMFTYCRNNSIAYQDGTGCCAKAWAAGYQGPCPGQGLPGCMDNMPQFKSKNKSNTSTIDPNVPPDHPNYIPPKKGSNEKVKNPNGQGKGWPAKDGGVWIPTPNMHGGEGWTVQYPGGKHEHAYPGGHVRKATKESNPIGGTVLLLLGVAGTIYFVGNDVTGILIADDFCIPSTMGFIALGMDQIVGKYVCECGESWYGFG